MNAATIQVIKEKLAQLDRVRYELSMTKGSYSTNENSPLKFNRPLNAAQIRRVEEKYQLQLPEEYKEFLQCIGNGGNGPGYRLFRLQNTVVDPLYEEWIFPPDHFRKDFPFVKTVEEIEEYPKESFVFKYPLNEEDFINDNFNIFTQGAIFICDEGDKHYDLLVLSGKEAGNVWFMDGTKFQPGYSHFSPRKKRLTFSEWYLEWIETEIAEIANELEQFKNPSKGLTEKTEIFEIERNPMSNLHDFPQNLPELKGLLIRNTKITSLEGLPENLPKLERLDLRANNIKHLSNFPHSVPKLAALDLSANKLTKFSLSESICKNLVSLNLSSNNLSHVDFHNFSFDNLSFLTMTKNKLTDKMKFPNKFQKLVLFDVAFNYFTNFTWIPDFENPSISIIYCGNPIVSFHGLNKKLWYILINNRNIDFLKLTLGLEKFLLKIQFNCLLSPYSQDLLLNLIKLPQNKINSDHIDKIIDQLMEYYELSPLEILQKYITNKTGISERELERIIYEGGEDCIQWLKEQKLEKREAELINKIEKRNILVQKFIQKYPNSYRIS